MAKTTCCATVFSSSSSVVTSTSKYVQHSSQLEDGVAFLGHARPTAHQKQSCTTFRIL